MPFSPDYVRLVLNENFEDAKVLFVAPLVAIHYAHLVMLTEQGIVAPAEARALRAALDRIDPDAVRRATYDGSCEDLFFYVNGLIARASSEEIAGRLHTARSRNDVDMTLYRMRLREWILDVAEAAHSLRRALLVAADAHRQTIMVAHTHAQPAQPTTLAHYLLAVVEALERDSRRLSAAYETTNRCPLGACAITGTGFAINRDRTSELLGFARPTGNTYGSIASVDYVLESAAAASVLLVGLGRVVQDLLLWSTREIGYLRLPDGFVQISSIMPQKRNPVALEHARALSSKALAELTAVAHAVHNTPFGDIVDTEDDLQPLVAVAFRDAARAVALVAATVAAAEFDVERMRARAAEGWITVTELADVLVRERALPFGVAHEIVSRFVRTAGSNAADLGTTLAAVARDLGHDVVFSDEALAERLSPERFVAVRSTPGGPAPDVTARAVEESRATLAADAAALRRAQDALKAAVVLRRQAVDAL